MCKKYYLHFIHYFIHLIQFFANSFITTTYLPLYCNTLSPIITPTFSFLQFFCNSFLTTTYLPLYCNTYVNCPYPYIILENRIICHIVPPAPARCGILSKPPPASTFKISKMLKRCSNMHQKYYTILPKCTKSAPQCIKVP